MSHSISNERNVLLYVLNKPAVKEGIKNVVSSITFVFGVMEVYAILKGRKISTESSVDTPKWMQLANKVIFICAKISLILSAEVSRPGVFVISVLVGFVFSTAQLEKVFGPNTVFAINPWHPRHVISIVAVILALPSVIQSTYQGISWVYRTICHYHKDPVNSWLTDAKIRLMALFNTCTSRPVLHLGNQFAMF
ncbi:MAG: hypothetical protein P4L16_06880 [Chlamydiales bacterium]|nr:hypothetical protein [Chlamydiales bacterium]